MRESNLTGNRYGRLTVLRRANSIYLQAKPVWRCVCDCGNITEVRSDLLRRGKTSSCGCLFRESARRNAAKAAKARTIYDDLAIGQAYSATRKNARRRGIEFRLAYEVYKTIIQNPCHYCNAPARLRGYIRSDGLDLRFYGHTLDRKDNYRGYTIDNAVSACARCNSRKFDKSYKRFCFVLKAEFKQFEMERKVGMK
jgi:hypothetical protein